MAIRVKIFLSGVLALILGSFTGYSQTYNITWNSYGGSCSDFFNSITAVPNVTTSQWVRGAGTCTGNGSGFSVTGYTQTSLAGAQSINHYMEATITAGAGTSFQFEGFSWTAYRSGTGPVNSSLQYSVNGGPFTQFGTQSLAALSASTATYYIPASPFVVVPAGGNIRIRIYLWGASGSTGTARVVNGSYARITMLSACTAPTISSVVTDVICNGGNNGEIDLTAAGGTSPYTYAWTGPNSFTSGSEDITGLTAGTYSVTVTATGNCTTSTTVIVNQPAAVASVITSSTNANCFGGTGSAMVTASGGDGNYTYGWVPSGGAFATANNLTAGPYTVTVTDGNGCSSTASVSITEPAEIVVNTTSVNVLCNGANTGSIDLTATGGAGTLDYNWSNSATTEDLSGLAAGTYNVTVTDDNGCTNTASVNITEASGIVLNTSSVNILCNGGNTGSIDLTASGGTGTLDYSWSNSAITEDISGLTAGIYNVTATDDNGCTNTTSVNISEPSALVLSTVVTNVACNGGNDGNIDLTVTGGTGTIDYNWSNSATTEDISGLAAGPYTITVTDDNGCTNSVSETITQSASLVLSTLVTHISCNGNTNGAIDLTVTGGTGTMDYNWNNSSTTEDLSGLAAGSYSVTVTDDNGCTSTTSVTLNQPSAMLLSTTITNVTCNEGSDGAIDLTVTGGTGTLDYDWSNFVVSQDQSGLTAGTYNVTVTDDNGCTVSASLTVTEPSEIILNLIPTPAVCHGYNNGSINLTTSGGAGSYSYSWSNSAITEDVSNLYYGYYTVTVTDGSGCTALASALVNEPADIHSALTVSACKSYVSPSGLHTWTSTGSYIDTLTAVSGCDSMITVELSITAPNVVTTVLDHTFTSFATGVNYQWVNCDNDHQPVSGATSSVFTPSMNGTFAVIINESGCIDTSDCLTTFNTGLDENEYTGDIHLYPNPNSGNFNLSVDGLYAGDASVFITDITGKMVYQQIIGNITGSLIQPVSVEGLGAGVYLLNLVANGRVKTIRFIVQ